MRKILYQLLIIIVIIFAVIFSACEEETGEDLYNPNKFVSGPAPKITNIETIYPLYDDSKAFAGIGEIKITGQNFLSDVISNTVYFENLQGTVLTASETELLVKTPNLLGDSVRIKISTNVDSFSLDYYYRLIPAIEEIFSFKQSEEPQNITCDANGNLFFTMNENGALSDSIWMLSTDGNRSGYGNSRAFDELRMGPNGELFGVHGTRSRLYSFPPGGGAQSLWLNVREKMKDFDFDANLNIWTAGAADEFICRVRISDKDIKKFEYPNDVQAIRVYDGDLYFASKTDSTLKIVYSEIISDDSLSAMEQVYVDLINFIDYEVVGMTFDVNGTLYIAVTAPEGIIKSAFGSGTYEPLYPELIDLTRTSISLAWGPQNETNLFLSRTAGYEISNGDTTIINPGIIKINTLSDGAPNYGRGDL